MIVVAKASSDDYVNFIDNDNITISEICEKMGDVIISKNHFYNKNIKGIQCAWGCNEEIAKKVSNCKFSMLVYDDYIED